MIQRSTSLKYEPSLELLRVTAEQLFSNRELYRSVQLSIEEFSYLLLLLLLFRLLLLSFLRLV